MFFSEDQRDIAELQVSGDGRRRREKIEIYHNIYVCILKGFFTCFNILMGDNGFSTSFIADLY